MKAVDFLKTFDPDGWHNLAAIDPETRHVEGRTFPPGSWDEINAWVEARDGRKNLYFSVNEPAPDAPNAKLAKQHIATVRALPADVDARAGEPLETELRRLVSMAGEIRNGKFPPTFATDSGGGVQLFWMLESKLPASDNREWAEAHGRGIAIKLKGDRVHNIERVMRLPGTLNVPDAAKRAKGRKERRASLLYNGGPHYTREAVGAVVEPVAAAEAAGDSDRRISEAMAALDMDAVRANAEMNDLPAALQERFKAAEESDETLRRLWSGDEGVLGEDASGSAFRGALATHLSRLGFSLHEYAQLLWIWQHAVVVGDDRHQKVTRRQIARDWIRMGGTSPTELLSDLGEPPPPNPFDEAAGQEKGSDPGRRGLRLLTVADIMQLPDPTFLVDRYLPDGGFGLFVGAPSARKSFLVLDMALHIAHGFAEWHGRKIRARQGATVLYIVGEGVHGFKDRISAWQQFHKIAEHTDNLRIVPQAVNFMDAESVTELVATVRAALDGARRPALVIIDTVRRATPGADENLQKDVGLFISACDRVRDTFECTVLAIHHTNREGKIRGSSVFTADADFEFHLEKNGSVTHVLCAKMKDGEDSWSEAFAFDEVGTPSGRKSLVPSRAAGVSVDLPEEKARAVLADMRAAWDGGEPWGAAPQAGKRYAVNVLIGRYDMRREAAEGVISLWVRTGVIEEQVASSRSKMKGYRVVGDLSGQDVSSGAGEEGIFD